MKRIPAPIFGAASGVLLYLLGLALHLASSGLPLRAHPGIGDAGYAIINVPAHVMASLVTVDALAPQGVGKIRAEDAAAMEARWSPIGFAVLGLAFYGALGAALGAAAAAARRRAVRTI